MGVRGRQGSGELPHLWPGSCGALLIVSRALPLEEDEGFLAGLELLLLQLPELLLNLGLGNPRFVLRVRLARSGVLLQSVLQFRS